MPFALLLLLFVFLEISGFVAMSGAVGLLGVFALILLGIVVGGYVIRTIGVAALARMQERTQAGEDVGVELGGLVLGFLGGLLLIVPGFLTDLIGVLFLIKPLQTIIWPRFGHKMAGRMPDVRDGARWQSPGSWRSPNASQSGQAGDIIIDAAPVNQEPQDGSSDERPGSARPGSERNPWGD